LDLERPFGKHIDNHQLNALVSASDTGDASPRLSPDAIRKAELHLRSCADCATKVSKYRKLIAQLSNLPAANTPPGDNCPDDIDWRDVATGLYPKPKATSLLLHAALCDHCGPQLHAATAQKVPADPQTPPLAARTLPAKRSLSLRWPLIAWLVPTMAALVLVGVLKSKPSPLPGPKFAELAVRAHREHAAGNLTLEVRSGSVQTLNAWLKAKTPFPLALPTSPTAEEHPLYVEGARLLQVRGKTAAYIAYHMSKGASSLIVTRDSEASASGGIVVDFTKLSFHYSTVEGYKVVTWSENGLTYALVSDEGNATQQSCMVCHSSMPGPDLSQTPAPLPTSKNAANPVS